MNFSLQNTNEPETVPTLPPPVQLPEVRSPARRRGSVGRKIAVFLALVLIAGAVVIIGSPGLAKPLTKMFAAAETEIITYPVKKMTLAVTVNEKGSLESAKNEDVLCQVEGGTTIIKILAEGTPVKKGDIVCELDSAALSDTLKNQQITTSQAEASYAQARLTREVAEVGVREYKEGIYKQDFETIKGEIALAQSDLTRAEDRLDWSNKMSKKGYVSEATRLGDELSLQKSKYSLEQAQTKMVVLEKFTKEKTIKELEAEVEKAKSDELAKKATWNLEKDKEAKLERQIKNCILKAPGDGLVVYANDPSRFGGQNSVQIEEGASVRERQKIFSLPDITQMRVNTKVHESMIDRITKGLRASIRVDAFAAETLGGAVQSVAPMADQNTFFGSDIKVYTTQIAIENGPQGLRPGMSANVEILIQQIPDVLAVPVQSLLEFKGKDYLYVKDPTGVFNRREVVVGTSNDKLIEIKKGLSEGDLIAMTPSLLMSDDDKREAFGGLKDAGKKDWGGDPSAKGADPTKAGVPGKAGPDAKGGPGGDPTKADAKGGAGGDPTKAKTKRAGGGQRPAFFSKLQGLPQEERMKMFTGTDEEKAEVAKKAGLTDEELEQLKNMPRRAPGGGGGGPGGGGGGFGGPGGGGGGGGGGGFGGGGGRNGGGGPPQ